MDMSSMSTSATGMDMSMSLSMSSSTSATGTAAGAPATTSSSMGGMGMGMGGGSSCKISMLWNWYTVDACFISRTWHITSAGMFAGSCIGVILLVCSLEFLRRLGKEYDRYLVRQFERQSSERTPTKSADEALNATHHAGGAKDGAVTVTRSIGQRRTFKPNALQQFMRALLHMLQFGVAYFIMLLAMYYNGYIIICILIGALIGSFIFNWETLGGWSGPGDVKDPTVCCG